MNRRNFFRSSIAAGVMLFGKKSLASCSVQNLQVTEGHTIKKTGDAFGVTNYFVFAKMDSAQQQLIKEIINDGFISRQEFETYMKNKYKPIGMIKDLGTPKTAKEIVPVISSLLLN